MKTLADISKLSPAEARAEIVATFQSGIEEAEKLSQEYATRGGFVIAWESDMLPFRTDGKTIAIYGGEIYVTDKRTADSVWRTLQDKTEKRLIVKPVRVWAARRAEVLNKMIQDIETRTEFNG